VQLRVIVQTLQEEHQWPMPPGLQNVPNFANGAPIVM
jgi:hypothetical protein